MFLRVLGESLVGRECHQVRSTALFVRHSVWPCPRVCVSAALAGHGAHARLMRHAALPRARGLRAGLHHDRGQDVARDENLTGRYIASEEGDYQPGMRVCEEKTEQRPSGQRGPPTYSTTPSPPSPHCSKTNRPTD